MKRYVSHPTTLHHRAFARVFVFALILSLTLPLPLAGSAAAQGANHGTAQGAQDAADKTAHVHARLNSPERAAAIAEAARQDAVMKATQADVAAAVSAANANGGTAQKYSAAARTTDPPIPPETEARPLRGIQSPTAPTAPGASAAPGAPGASAPKSLSLILAQQAAALLGVPGPMGEYNQDEGLGFHQDGTARKAGGASASGYGTDGRRAAAYSQYGLAEGYNRGLNDPGYDPITGSNWRIGDPTSGGRISGQNGMGLTLDQFDPARAAMDRGLSYTLGLANSAGEAALSGLVDGARARLNFSIDWDGRINGEGDVLYPFYDSQYTTIYTQLGARSMSGQSGADSGDSADGSGADRWIGNAGIGQRWFPQAQSLTESGNWMLGYNAFYDYDFTRSHQRSGLGLEAQYDWLRVATNYYFPLSNWRDSKDFDGDFIKERAAEGWDLRVKGYLPFYRNVAVTGAYSQWFGDYVGMFSSGKLERDPKVWSYGLEYTPIPLVSGFVNQRSTEQSRSDTEFGLRFTYHFQMPLEDQISHAKVAELRTVSGSRHEFVDRENRIILEYKAKNNFHIEYLAGESNANTFVFRIRNGFDIYVVGQTVRVTAANVVLVAEAPAPAPQTLFAKAVNFLDELISVKEAYADVIFSSYMTDSTGRIYVHTSALPGTLTVQAGDSAITITTGSAEPLPEPSPDPSPDPPPDPLPDPLTAEILVNNSPADNVTRNAVRARFYEADGVTPVADGTTVNWSLPASPAGVALAAAGTTTDGWADMTLTDGQIGNRDVVVRASSGGVDRDITVRFGAPVLTFGALSNSTPITSLGGSSTITSAVTFADGSTAANLPNTAITWMTRNNASTSASTSTTTRGTNAAGTSTFRANNLLLLNHVMYVQASEGAGSVNTTVQFGALVPGFITGSPSVMTWETGNTFCSNQGGQLPSRAQLEAISGTNPGNWSVSLYWTRDAGGVGRHWVVSFIFGGAFFTDGNFHQVVCVR